MNPSATTATPPPARPKRRVSLTVWILIAMVMGSVAGYFVNESFPTEAARQATTYQNLTQSFQVLSTLFLHLVKCIVVPIIFSTLVVGIAAHSDDLKTVGRLALRSVIYFEVVTTLALVVGLLAVNVIKPGVGVTLPPPDPNAKEQVSKPRTTKETIEHIAPESFFDSAARNDVLQVVVFAAIFGVALTQVKGKPKETMINFFEGVSEVMFKFTALIMNLAPVGIAGALAYTVAHSGAGVLKQLLALILTLYGALVVFALAVLLPVALLARIPILKFLRAIREPALIAFSTTSSEAALPVAMERMTEFGVPKRIISFVLPAGYSFNLDGSTLHLAVASVFIAQAGGITLTLTQQIVMLLTLMLTSKGVAAVPRATTVILAGTVVTFGLPLEGVILIMAVDAIMDMARTTMNVVGNCLASAVMARWEGELEA